MNTSSDIDTRCKYIGTKHNGTRKWKLYRSSIFYAFQQSLFEL